MPGRGPPDIIKIKATKKKSEGDFWEVCQMAKLFFIQITVSDFLADTGDLSPEELGAYVRLAFNHWLRPLPLEDERLRRLANVSTENWGAVRNGIKRFFDESWVSQDLTEKRASAEEAHLRRAAAGKRGGQAKHGSRNANTQLAPGFGIQTNNHKTLPFQEKGDMRATRMSGAGIDNEYDRQSKGH